MYIYLYINNNYKITIYSNNFIHYNLSLIHKLLSIKNTYLQYYCSIFCKHFNII